MAGSNDFTGQNIQDTYQRVLQISSSGELADGTGSLVPLLEVTASHAISASHEITKEVSSSYAETASMASDSFIVQGNITASGNISASGTIFGDKLTGPGGSDGLIIDATNGVQIIESDAYITNPSRLTIKDGDLTVGSHITASGDISASGNLHISSSITFGDGVAQIVGPGNNDYLQLSTDDVSIFINGNEVVNVDNDSINLNASNQDIDVKITHDNGVNAFNSDASANRVKLRDFVTIGSGSAPNADPNALYVSGSQFNSSHITASGDISASGTITAATMSIAGVYTDGQSPIQFREDIRIFDGHELRIGTGPSGAESSDLKLYHDGTDSYIEEGGTGDLIVLQTSGDTIIKNYGTDDGIKLVLDKNPGMGSVGSTGTVLISGSANSGIRLDVRGDISASGDIVINEGQKLILDGNDTAGLTPAGNTYIHNAGTADEIEFYVGGTQKLEIKQTVTHFNNGAFKVTGQITASGDISASGNLILDGNVTASGNISASGTVSADQVNIDGYIALNTDGSTQGRVFSGGSITGIQIGRNGQTNRLIELLGPVTASNHISASGDVIADRYFLQGTRILSNSGTEIQINETTLPININGPSINLAAPVTASGIISASGTGSFTGGGIFGGDVNIEKRVSHIGDSDTFIEFSENDRIDLQTGGGVRVRLTNTLNTLNQDTHVEGNVTASGNISASGDFEGNSYQIQGKSGITYNSSNTRIIYGQNNQNSRLRGKTITLGDDATQHVTASGIISSSGNILTSGDIVALGNISTTASASFQHLEIEDQIIHSADTETRMRFSSDTITFDVGGTSAMLTIAESSQDIVTIGNGNDVDFKVRTANDDNVIFTQGSTDRVGIGTLTPSSKLSVNGDMTVQGNVTASAIISGSQKVLSHEYHYCYHTTADDFKGDIVRFGTGPGGDVGNLVAGKLYCYQSDTHWELADADTQALATGMLGICVADGTAEFLVKGFAASAGYTSLDTAGPIFISATAGGVTATVPASSNQYVRVVGYCTDATSRAIYFDPDKTWVKRS